MHKDFLIALLCCAFLTPCAPRTSINTNLQQNESWCDRGIGLTRCVPHTYKREKMAPGGLITAPRVPVCPPRCFLFALCVYHSCLLLWFTWPGVNNPTRDSVRACACRVCWSYGYIGVFTSSLTQQTPRDKSSLGVINATIWEHYDSWLFVACCLPNEKYMGRVMLFFYGYKHASVHLFVCNTCVFLLFSDET